MKTYEKPMIQRYRVETLEVPSALSGGDDSGDNNGGSNNRNHTKICNLSVMKNSCIHNGCANYKADTNSCLLGKTWN